MEKIDLNFTPTEYFANPINTSHRQYLALRAYFYENMSATEVSEKFSYTINTVYSLIRDFKETLETNTDEDPFFKSYKIGRKEIDSDGSITKLIIDLRKKYISVPEIKSTLDGQSINVSERYITKVLKKDGFARIPRRDNETRNEQMSQIKDKVTAQKAQHLLFEHEVFSTQLAGILCFLPYIKLYALDKAIENSKYPETQSLNRLSSVLCFLSLKLSNIRRYSCDDIWCMDRGMGLFAGLNVLPKAAWFSSYSSGITRDMNLDFLKSLCVIWKEKGLLSDTMNIDFTSIPYWGDDDHLENNWSGKRNKVISSMLAVLAQDPDSGIICYGDSTVRHKNQNDVVLEFMDFYKDNKKENDELKYLVFDSKSTTYENLNNLNKQNIKFVTIRRRGKTLVEKIKNIPKEQWKNIIIERDNGRSRTIKAFEETGKVKGYEGILRHIYITDNGKIKPAIIITNEFEMSLKDVVRKYSKRWLVEKGISEQIHFFHFNHNSSGIAIKVDFDFTMTILAHNVYRLFAMNLEGYSHCEDQRIFEKFILNAGEVEILDNSIEVRLKKKRNLPLLIEKMNEIKDKKIPWFSEKDLNFIPSTTT
jgi:transposase